MSWNGKFDIKPLVMLEYERLDESIAKNAYKLDEESSAALPSTEISSEEFLQFLENQGKHKEACDYLAYALNHRCAVWWASLCVKSVREDRKKLELSGDLKKKKMDKQAVFAAMLPKLGDGSPIPKPPFLEKLSLPEGMKPDLPPLTGQAKLFEPDMMGLMADKGAFLQRLEKYRGKIDELSSREGDAYTSKIQDMRTKLTEANPELSSFANSEAERMRSEAVRAKLAPTAFDPQSTFAAKTQKKMLQINDKAQKIRKNTGFKFPSGALPKRASNQKIDKAYEAAFRWVVAPNELNSQLARDAGKAATPSIEGLLAASAFWAGGNMAPERRDMLVATPPGVASNGVRSVLLKCALAKEGDKDFDDRYQDYFHIGIQVAQGLKVWDPRYGKVELNPQDEDFSHDENKTVEKDPWDGQSGFGRIYDNNVEDDLPIF